MDYFNIEYISIVTGFLLLLLGIFAILTQKNLIKIVIGFSLFDTGIHIVMVSIGYIRNRTAPILDKAVDAKDAVNQIVDPVPQALVLTAIVIGLGVTALMLAYVLKLHKEKKSLDIKDFSDLKW
ncbi:MAG: sodium:proton antiporter [Bacteroidales bacterium]|jgi:multisubunit Na+/H+ antiporter MnhC subunit|nr:sodium:proton antiporter [Bacteroidales bacterium]